MKTPHSATSRPLRVISRSNNTFSLIQRRRSIRCFLETEIDPVLLNQVIEAGLWAPSGKNIQNWRFFVLTKSRREQFLALSQQAWLKIRASLQKRLKPSLYQFTERYFFTLGNAPAVVLAYAECPGVNNPQSELGNVYMAVQNIILAAESVGLGSCVMGSFLEIEAEINSFLGDRANGLKLVCGITLGYPSHSPPAADRRSGRICFIEE